MNVDKEAIRDLVRIMRSEGISQLEWHGIRLVLDRVATQGVENSYFPDESNERAPCGHHVWETNEFGKCYYGCEAVQAKVEE